MCGFDPKITTDSRNLPRLSFGSWVGGDRDGHPLVTAETTRETLQEMRRHAIRLVRHHLEQLASKLSISGRFQSPTGAMEERMEIMRHKLGEAGQCALDRNRHEPWRQFLNLMLTSLPDKSLQEHFDEPAHYQYKRHTELLEELELLMSSFMAIGATTIASGDVAPVYRIVQTFGFHLGGLDIRQNSRFHEIALSQLMMATELDGSGFPEWSEEKRMEFLERELLSPRPFTHPDM